MKNQLKAVYSTNLKSSKPVRLSLAGLGSSGAASVDDIGGYEHWEVERLSGTVYDSFPSDKTCYLSPDATVELQDISEDMVYVIGGLVDRKPLKDCTRLRAESHGVRTARLPLDRYIRVARLKLLPINQVFQILLDFNRTGSWELAIVNNVPRSTRLATDVHAGELLG